MENIDYKVKRISLGMVSSFLVFKPGSAILVDSGNSGSEERIVEVLGRNGLDPGMLKLLILTHVHADHAGSARGLKELTGCRIMVHESEKERLQRGFAPIPGGTRWKARLLVALGRTVARRLGKFPGVEADLTVEHEAELDEFGFPGRVIHTPGHTHGSMVVLMEQGELIAGDTFFGLKGKVHFPPFAEDLPALLHTWRSLRSLPVKTIYPAHGRYFDRANFLDEFDQAMERYG